MCTSPVEFGQVLQNEYSLAKIVLNAAENEPSKICQHFENKLILLINLLGNVKQINKLRTRRGNSLGRCLYSQLALPDGLPRPRGRHRVGFALFLFSAREGGLRERGEVAIM